MKPLYRSAIVAVVQCLIVLSVAGKYTLDRERLPRVWARATAVDPNLFVRGRYVSLGLEVNPPPAAPPSNGVAVAWTGVRLSVVGDRLVATPDPQGTLHVWERPTRTAADPNGRQWVLAEPVAFFIPEHIPDPTHRAAGEELWAEVTVPEKGVPRPIQLGVKKDGLLTPLELR
ncbi:MAG: hypothetical protein ABSC93_23570, partial [Bryobacteraceae bacterium]|jgi:hypothetical protein